MVVHPEDYQGEDGIFGLSLWVTNFFCNRHLHNFLCHICMSHESESPIITAVITIFQMSLSQICDPRAKSRWVHLHLDRLSLADSPSNSFDQRAGHCHRLQVLEDIITIIITIIITVLIIIAVIVMFELLTLHYSDHRYHSLSPCTVANVAKVNFLCHSLLSSEFLFYAIDVLQLREGVK